jgi:hypothetical protein
MAHVRTSQTLYTLSDKKTASLSRIATGTTPKNYEIAWEKSSSSSVLLKYISIAAMPK